MTDEQPPEGMETKDVHTMSGGTFQGTEAGTPGYHPAAVPNRNVTVVNDGEEVHEFGTRPAEQDSDDSGSDASGSSSTKSTAAKSTRSSSASKS